MNPWDDLPNGKRIDEVLEFARDNPNAGGLMAAIEARNAMRSSGIYSDWYAAWDVVRDTARVTSRDDEWTGVLRAISRMTGATSQSVARDAVTALVVFDHAGDLYDADISVVEMAVHARDPAATLMLGLLKVMKHTKEKP